MSQAVIDRAEALRASSEMQDWHREVADLLRTLLRATGRPVVTMTWPDFYTATKSKPVRGRDETLLWAAGLGLGIAVAFGNVAVIVAFDRAPE